MFNLNSFKYETERESDSYSTETSLILANHTFI